MKSKFGLETMNNNTPDNPNLQAGLLAIVLDLPWLAMIGNLWRIGRRILRGFANEGIYEVLDYECTLELKDRDGKKAIIHKREKVRYLQDYIIAYEDQAWGDGEILLDYHCSPGVPVDEYRLGHKTYKLISLREFKNKGDVDEFNIEWKMRNGFLKQMGFWGISINHRTNKVTIKVIFPKNRPPRNVSVTESNLQRTRNLGKDSQQILADGRSMIVWENTNPRLYEDYILKWEW